MTTSSGKPPRDEGLDIDRNAERAHPSLGATAAGGAGSGGAAPHEATHSTAVPGQQLYGLVVPYGGDDRTEEIEPIALEMPFENARDATPSATPRAASPAAIAPARRPPVSRPPAPAQKRDFEMPVANLLVSDLFDSSPPPPGAALEPPDLAAFSTHPPPPNGAVEAPPAATPSSRPSWPGARRQSSVPPAAAPQAPSASEEDAITVVGMPSIDVGATPPSPPAARSSRPPPAPFGAIEVDQPRAEMAPPAEPARGDEAVESSDQQRRSVPTLESAGNAASKRSAAEQASDKLVAGSDGAALPALPEAGAHPDAARFPSDVPTSRPPDVVRSPSAEPPSARRAPARAAQSGITAPAPVIGAAQPALPSVMLAPEVEAETANANRRALRAARATVRLELPPNFGRPGSPIQPGAPAMPAMQPLPDPVVDVVRPPSVLARYGTWIAAALLILAGIVVLLLPSGNASLVVNALGPGQRAVEGLQIFVDGTALCNASPCEISLSAGEHRLRATARGLSSGDDQIVNLEGGAEAILNLQLVPLESEQQSAGLRVPATEPPRVLYVDGTRIGKLPREVSGLAAGKHWIKLDAEDGTPPIEKAVTLLPGQMMDVAPTAAKPDKALVTILLSAESEGASVTLDEAFLLDFPAELELEPGSKHTLTATKPGYEDYMLQLQADAGGTEKSVEIALAPLSRDVPAPRPKVKAARKAAAGKAPSVDPTQGLLNISSVPPSQVILNGRPLGSTPKTAVPVPGDSLQTIVFVHPKMGRRRAQKFVPAGKERTVAIRF